MRDITIGLRLMNDVDLILRREFVAGLRERRRRIKRRSSILIKI